MALAIQKLSKSYPVKQGGSSVRKRVFSEFDLSVPDGEFLVLAGPNGCGKTTLLKMVAGLLPPDQGRVTFNPGGGEIQYAAGSAWQNMTQIATLVFQEYDKSLFPWQTTRRALEWGYKGLEKDRVAILTALIDKMGLDRGDLLDRFPRKQSGGQKQRVAVARAFACKPGLLLMDEPFGSLDAFYRYELEQQLLDVWAAVEHPTVILATHDTEEAILLGQRIVVLGGRPARIVGEVSNATPRDVRSREYPEASEFGSLRRRVRLLIQEAAKWME